MHEPFRRDHMQDYFDCINYNYNYIAMNIESFFNINVLLQFMLKDNCYIAFRKNSNNRNVTTARNRARRLEERIIKKKSTLSE